MSKNIFLFFLLAISVSEYYCAVKEERLDVFYNGYYPKKRSIREDGDTIFKLSFGGENAKRNYFPFMALLGYDNKAGGLDWFCGGSLISNRYVLTAGHCTYNNNLVKVSRVTLGILKRSDPASLWTQYFVEVIRHPEYRPPVIYNDIALLKTHKRVIFTRAIRPVRLPFSYRSHTPADRDRKKALALGWGVQGTGKKVADILQVVELDLLSNDVCKTLYKPYRNFRNGFNTTTQVCYGNMKREKDTCAGDSGGPLVIPGQKFPNKYTIVAVISTGENCPATAGMYTNVEAFLPWIESIVRS